MARRIGLPGWVGVLVLVSVLTAVVIWKISATTEPWPTAAEAETDIVGRSGASSARCETPGGDGWRCTLRRADGGYGQASAVPTTVESGRRGLRTTVHWSWDLDVGPDGAYETVVTAVNSPSGLANGVAFSTTSPLRAVGAVVPYVRFTCPPGPPVGGTVICTGSPLIPTASVTRLGDDLYRARYRLQIMPPNDHRLDTTASAASPPPR